MSINYFFRPQSFSSLLNKHTLTTSAFVNQSVFCRAVLPQSQSQTLGSSPSSNNTKMARPTAFRPDESITSEIANTAFLGSPDSMVLRSAARPAKSKSKKPKSELAPMPQILLREPQIHTVDTSNFRECLDILVLKCWFLVFLVSVVVGVTFLFVLSLSMVQLRRFSVI